MTCRIRFASEIVVSGKDLRKIWEKFMAMDLYHPEISEQCDFVDIEEVARVDDDSYTDFTSDFNCMR